MTLNCIIVDDDEITRQLISFLVNQTKFLNLIAVCKDSMEASQILLNERVDLMILDVEMPGISGLEFLKSLGPTRPQVILITSNKEYALEAFEFDVTDFLVKPASPERFLRAVFKAKHIYETNYTQFVNFSNDHEIFVKVDS